MMFRLLLTHGTLLFNTGQATSLIYSSLIGGCLLTQRFIDTVIKVLPFVVNLSSP